MRQMSESKSINQKRERINSKEVSHSSIDISKLQHFSQLNERDEALALNNWLMKSIVLKLYLYSS